MKNITNIISSIIIGLAIIASSFYFVKTYQDIETEKITNQARFDCAQSSRFTTSDENGNQVWYPVEELYNKCLSQKGL